LDGPQLAGWTPCGKRVEHRVLFELDVGVPRPDGVVLRGDLYRPDTAEPSPALLGWSPYNKDLMPTGLPAPFNEPGAVGYLASRSYAVLVAGAGDRALRGCPRAGDALRRRAG
jgi:predicted acyl esterase